MRSQLKKVTSVILCVCMLMSILAITSFADGTTATISFADKANRTAYSADQQIWVQNGITVTNDKGESTSNVGDYANPGRFYKSSTFKIEYPGMTKIEIDCTGMDAKHVKAWTDSFEGATENGGIVTVEFAQAVDSAFVKMAAQGRANSITVYAAAGSEEGGEKVAANLTSDIGIMYVGAPGVYEGVTTLVTEVGTHNFSWDKAVLLEKVADNVYEVIATAPGDGKDHNLAIENADQLIVAANGGNNWPSLFETANGTEWFYNSSNSHGVAYVECPNFCSEHIGAWFANVGKMEIGSYYKFVGIDPTAPAVDANYAVDYVKDPTYGYTKSDYVTYSFLTATEAPVVEDDESYKDTYTYVDGDKVGTIQQLGADWEGKPASDFWYLVDDTKETVTVSVVVDDRTIVEDDTMLRVWIDADVSDTARTTLVDIKVKDGAAYVARIDGGFDAAVLNTVYAAQGNDYSLAVVLDKATLTIDGEYRLNVQLGQTGSTTMHSIKYDNVTGEGATYAPWNTTEFYEVFGKEVKTTLTIEEAIALGESKEHNTYTDEKYYVTGIITSVYNEQYGNMYIEDENGNRLTIYGTYSADGELRYDAMEVKPVKGDTVTIYGRVGQYSGTAQIKNGWIVDHVPGEGDDEEEVPDPEADSTLTIEQAIALGASKDHNNYTSNKYYVTGVITEVYNEQYGNMKITDDNGNILTIYGTYSADGELRYDALEVKPVVGDTVTIYGIVGQYNDVAQVKNGWITAHTAASGNESSDDVSDESTEDDTPVLGDSGFVIEMVIVMVIALAAVAVVYRTKRRA